MVLSSGGPAGARPHRPVLDPDAPAVLEVPAYVPPPAPVYKAPAYVPPPAPVYKAPVVPEVPRPVVQAPVIEAPVVKAPVVPAPVIPDVPKPAVVADIPKPAVVVPAPVVPDVPKPAVAAATVPDPKVPAAAAVVPNAVSAAQAASAAAANAATKAANAAASVATNAGNATVPDVKVPALPKAATVTAPTVTLPGASAFPTFQKPEIPNVLTAGLPNIQRPNFPTLPNIGRPALVTTVTTGTLDDSRHRSTESSRESVSATDLAWLGTCWNGSQVTVTNACLRAVAAHASWFDGCNFNFWVQGAGWIRTSGNSCAQALQFILGVRGMNWDGCGCEQYTFIAPSGQWCTGYYRNNVFIYTGYYPRWVQNANQAQQAQAAGQVVFEPPSVTAIVGDSTGGADVKLASAPGVPAAPTAALTGTTALSQAMAPGIIPVSNTSSRNWWQGPALAIGLAMLIAAWFTDRRKIELETKFQPPTPGGGRIAGGFA
ncbi:MAG: hypothetical protein LLG14_15485 [Nocardiaceae bacterium]|nr:hypothetical protein [Nocardiaceae bacterium]